MIVRLLSWHDEDPAHLRRTLQSSAELVDRVIALPGRYAHYTDATTFDYDAQVQAIQESCSTLILPPDATPVIWESESAKRTALLQLAHDNSQPGDWLISLDADTDLGPGQDWTAMRRALQATDRGTADVLHRTHLADGKTESAPLTILFRRQPQPITVDLAHFQYRCGDLKLWGYGSESPEPADLTDLLVVDHWNVARDPVRAAAARDYYSRRDALKLEKGRCDLCRHRTADRTVPLTWHAVRDSAGRRGGMATNAEVCDPCLPEAKRKAYAGCRRIGLNPDAMQATIHPTSPPTPLSAFFTRKATA